MKNKSYLKKTNPKRKKFFKKLKNTLDPLFRVARSGFFKNFGEIKPTIFPWRLEN